MSDTDSVTRCGYETGHYWELVTLISERAPSWDDGETYWRCRACGHETKYRYCSTCDSGQDRPCGQEVCPL